jgi:hypothetical protein
MITKKSEIDFKSNECLYSEKHCFEYKDAVYEDLRSFKEKSYDANGELIEFRVIFEECDYDYVAENYSEEFKQELRKCRDTV